MPEDEQMQSAGRVTEELPIYPAHRDTLLYILARERIGDILGHLLRGHVYNTEDETWEKGVGVELMNDQGVRTIVTIINSYTSVDKIATSLSDEEVVDMVRTMRNDIAYKLAKSRKEFEIDDSNLSLILDLVTHTIHANLAASRNATLINLLKPTYTKKEFYTPEKKRGMLSYLPFFGGD